MNDEVTQEDVFEVVERKSREGSYLTAGDIAGELGRPPPDVLQILGQLRKNGTVEQSVQENGDPIWYVGDRIEDVEEEYVGSPNRFSK